METDAAKATEDLLGMFHDNFRGTVSAVDGMMVHPVYRDSDWRRRFFRLSHDLRGLGGTFNYDLLTIVGESLCGLIRNEALPRDRTLQRHILAHVEALRAILQFDLKGDGGEDGKQLLTTLKVDQRKPQAN